MVDDNLVQIEKEYTETKDKLSKDIQDQKTDYNRRVEELKKEQEKAVETAVEKLKADHAAAIKRLEEASAAKDGQIAELLREKASWIEEKDGLEDSIGLQYDEGFSFALEQVKVLFPDIDAARLGEADALSKIVNGALVPFAPVE